MEQKCLVRSKRAEDWTEVFVSCGQFHSEVHFIASTREPGGLKFAQRWGCTDKTSSKLLRRQFRLLSCQKWPRGEHHVGASIGFAFGGSIISTNLKEKWFYKRIVLKIWFKLTHRNLSSRCGWCRLLQTLCWTLWGNSWWEVEMVHFYRTQVREADLLQNGRIFGKVPKGGGRFIFNPKIYIADFCHYRQYFGHEFQKKICMITFRKWGGGQKPFGTFPKIHPIC